ncbi:rhomboid family intramembrane serine protease [Rothia sp. P13129]|uniref:rhomboid family intramembrane serine protease n=1 Tax=unclassified Rothia (in: high G+C Gram-positive bacteria) TaxID=2689056 RepID=UPI003ACFAFD6
MAYARCKQCQKPTCGDCQIPVEVGILCRSCHPDRTSTQKMTRAIMQQGSPLITYLLIALTTIVYGAQLLIPGHFMFNTFAFNWNYVLETHQWWRFLTSGFLHSQGNISHLALNMFSLWLFGRELEFRLGRIKFIALYLCSIIGGSIAVSLASILSFAPSVTTIGASGGVFGLFGAFWVLTRLRGENSSPILVLIAINMAYSFFFPGISWEAHLGGMFTGAAVTWLMQKFSHQGR